MNHREASEQIVAEFPELFSEAFDVYLPPGWYTIAQECCTAIVAIEPSVRVCQLKEKFGGARLYVGGASDEVHRLIGEFEKRSFGVCETCGDLGSANGGNGGWVRTLCSRHAKQ